MVGYRHKQALLVALGALVALGWSPGPSHAQRADRPGSSELQGGVDAYFGPRRPGNVPPQQQQQQIPTAPRQPGTTRTPWQEIGPPMRQQEQRDPPTGRIVVEESIIHNVRCPNGATIYVYQYLKRPFFRAIRPPDWGRALGGRDFGTFAEAASAGCASVMGLR